MNLPGAINCTPPGGDDRIHANHAQLAALDSEGGSSISAMQKPRPETPYRGIFFEAPSEQVLLAVGSVYLACGS